MMSEKDINSVSNKVLEAWRLRAEILRTASDADGRLKDVRKVLLDAANALRAENEHEVLVSVLRKLGHVEQDMGDITAAIALNEEAYVLSQSIGNKMLLAHSARHLADSLRENGNPNKAETLYNETLSLYESQPNTATLDYANAIRSMAILKQQLGKNDEAVSLWQQAKTLYADVGIADGVDECENMLESLQ